MGIKFKEIAVMTLFVAVLGGTIGGITWALLFIMNLGINFLWTDVRNTVDLTLYPVIVCALWRPTDWAVGAAVWCLSPGDGGDFEGC